jgi:hypothetical protein
MALISCSFSLLNVSLLDSYRVGTSVNAPTVVVYIWSNPKPRRVGRRHSVGEVSGFHDFAVAPDGSDGRFVGEGGELLG